MRMLVIIFFVWQIGISRCVAEGGARARAREAVRERHKARAPTVWTRRSTNERRLRVVLNAKGLN